MQLQGVHGAGSQGARCSQVSFESRDKAGDANGCVRGMQEVSIMRKVRHKHVVQFIGACTRQPNLCILVEYMAGGSVYDYMRRKGLFLPSKVAEIGYQVAKGATPMPSSTLCALQSRKSGCCGMTCQSTVPRVCTCCHLTQLPALCRHGVLAPTWHHSQRPQGSQPPPR